MQTNMTTTLDDSKEYIIYDTLHVIFRHLTLESLRTVAAVSWQWNDAANREIMKRGALQRVLLPVPYDVQVSRFNCSDYFNVKPNIVLMFCGPRPNMRPILSLEFKIMEDYYRRLPGRIIMLGVDKAMMDTQEVRSCKLQTFYKSDAPIICNNILALSLPNCKDFTFQVVECVSHEKNTEHMAAQVFRKLHKTADQLDNPIFLLFSRHDYTIGPHVMRMFQNKYGKKAINLWGSTIGDFIKRSDDEYPNYRGTHGFLGIVMNAPRLTSHCFVLHSDHDDVMAMKLSNFRRSLKLKRRSLGLVCGPRHFVPHNKISDSTYFSKYHYPDDLMKLVKTEFPTIEFTAMFNDPDFYYYGCDHTSQNGEYTLQHKGALSIMILTYD